jgi:formylmethanofuran dehydrogenase subunit C
MIRLTLKSEPPVRISLKGFIPETLTGHSEDQIARQPVLVGRHRSQLGDWFAIRRSEGADEMIIEGACRRFDHIGAGMSGGALSVVGSAGAYLGMGMNGGKVSVEGSAGFGAATAMKGGEIRVSGDVGEALGGALPGDRDGMRNGLVAVSGNAGPKCGDRLRQGTIVVVGHAGPLCGTRMIAGTIVIGGRTSSHLGIGMWRGSIVVLGSADTIAPSFTDCGIQDLVFFRLLALMLSSIGFDDLSSRVGPLRRWRGDRSVRGRGEILVAS